MKKVCLFRRILCKAPLTTHQVSGSYSASYIHKVPYIIVFVSIYNKAKV